MSNIPRPKAPSASSGASARAKTTKVRWTIILGGAVVAAFLISMMTSPGAPVDTGPGGVQKLNLTPKSLTDEKSWQAMSQGDIQELRARLGKLEQENLKLRDAIPATGAVSQLPTHIPPPPGVNLALPPPRLPDSGAGVPSPVAGAAPLVTPTNVAAPSAQGRAPQDPFGEDLPAPAKSAGSPRSFNFAAPPVSAGGSAAPATDDRGSAASAPPPGGLPAPVAAAQVKEEVAYTKNEFAGYMPMGFVAGSLLHGIDAGTGAGAQSNPQPVLMRISNNAVLPGASKYKLNGCFVLMSATGNLSAERVEAQASRIACVDRQNTWVLDQAIKGYLVDADGVFGLRGTVTTRQGAKLGMATLAGIGQALAASLGTQGVSTTGLTDTSSTSLNFGSIMGSGASTGIGKVADFYLKQAETMFPIISIQTGRNVTLVLQEGTSLKWNSAKDPYKSEVTVSAVPTTAAAPAK